MACLNAQKQPNGQESEQVGAGNKGVDNPEFLKIKAVSKDNNTLKLQESIKFPPCSPTPA